MPIQPNQRTCRTQPILSPITPQNRLVNIVTISINPQILNQSEVVNPTVSVNTTGIMTTSPNSAHWLIILTTPAVATGGFLKIVTPLANSINISFGVNLSDSFSEPFLSLTKNTAIKPPIKMNIIDDHNVPIKPIHGMVKLGKYVPKNPMPTEYIAQNHP